jgi:hypothetical protein
VSVERPPNLPPRKKLAVEQPLGGNAAQGGRVLIYVAVTLVLAGLAGYNAVVQQLPLTSPYVAAPAIGALWFALRLFMIWGSNARG